MIKTVCSGNVASHEDAIKWIRFIIEQTSGLLTEARIADGLLSVDDMKSIFELHLETFRQFSQQQIKEWILRNRPVLVEIAQNYLSKLLQLYES